MSSNTDDYTFEGGAFVPYSMTREEIAQVRTIAFRRFYSRPGFILRRLLTVRSLYDLKTVTKGARSFFWLWARGDTLSMKRPEPRGQETKADKRRG